MENARKGREIDYSFLRDTVLLCQGQPTPHKLPQMTLWWNFTRRMAESVAKSIKLNSRAHRRGGQAFSICSIFSPLKTLMNIKLIFENFYYLY